MLSIDHDTGIVLLSVCYTGQSLKTCMIELLCTERAAIEEDNLLVMLVLDP